MYNLSEQPAREPAISNCTLTNERLSSPAISIIGSEGDLTVDTFIYADPSSWQAKRAWYISELTEHAQQLESINAKLRMQLSRSGETAYMADAQMIYQHGIKARLADQDVIISIREQMHELQLENDRLQAENDRLLADRERIQSDATQAIVRERETIKRYYEARLRDSDSFIEERETLKEDLTDMKLKAKKLKGQRDQMMEERDYWRQQAEEWRSIADRQARAPIPPGNQSRDAKTGRFTKIDQSEKSISEKSVPFQCWLRNRLNGQSYAVIAKSLFDEGITDRIFSTDTVRIYIGRIQSMYDSMSLDRELLIRTGVWYIEDDPDYDDHYNARIKSRIDQIDLPYSEE